jgi:hypothetical protein
VKPDRPTREPRQSNPAAIAERLAELGCNPMRELARLAAGKSNRLGRPQIVKNRKLKVRQKGRFTLPNE